MIWYFLLFLHFIVIILGILSHSIFMKLVVFEGIIDNFCRIRLGLISTMMVVMLVTHLLQILVCLSVGTAFEDAKCAELPIKTVLLCAHRFAEAFSLMAQLLFTIERVLFIQFSWIHQSLTFKVFFVFACIFENLFSIAYVYTVVIIGGYAIFWLIIFQSSIFANFPFVYYAKRTSNSKYKAHVTTYSLKRKHTLYNLYEIARCFLYSTAIYMIAQLACFLLLWGAVIGLLFTGDKPKLIFVVSFIWNSNLAVFPWIVMLIHRSKRERIYRFWTQMFPAGKAPIRVFGMNGKELVTTPTQTDYFNQLQKAWG